MKMQWGLVAVCTLRVVHGFHPVTMRSVSRFGVASSSRDVRICLSTAESSSLPTASGSLNGVETMQLQHDSDSFTTDVQHLRIEDTDAYGIMYNGNYLKHYARALEGIKDDGTIVGFKRMRFTGSPSLGEAFVVRGQKTESSEWNLRLESADVENNQEYNSVEGLIVSDDRIPPGKLTAPFENDSSTECLHLNEYTVYKDEFAHNNHLCLTTILNYFERPRSQSLGGATGLSKLQEDGILAVVTRIDDLQLWQPTQSVVPGDTVQIRSYATLRRKSIVRYTQMALVKGLPLAQADITVMTIDQESKRPKPLPPWALRAIFLKQ